MFNQKFLLTLLTVLALLCARVVFSQSQNSTRSFSFSLKYDATTSAGVFKSDGTLLRTLWSNVKYNSGTYTKVWDGLTNDGFFSNDSDCHVEVLSNDVKYTWEGVVGNTSASKTGGTKIRALKPICSMAISGTNAYYCTNYGEQQTASFKFNTSSVQSKMDILGKSGAITYVATDDKLVYWASYDPNESTKSFVYGTKVGNDAEVSFINGKVTTVNYGSTHPSAIDVLNRANSKITGLAVQKTGNYLFVAHQYLNQLDVLNKKTGALIKTLTLTSPREIYSTNNSIWIITGKGTVAKYKVNSDGTIGAASIILNGLVAPLSLSVSPDNNTVVVIDGGNSQQLKAFNNNTGATKWTYGQRGGYATDATVTKDKFDFQNNLNVDNHAYIAFQPDGSFWVGDVNNYRNIHFDANRHFVENICYVPSTYSAGADRNDATRVFADYLEFSTDLDKTLGGTNGSWTLVKNWGAKVPSAYDNGFRRLKGVATLSNKRTYATLFNGTGGFWEIVELVEGGQLRFTGVRFTGENTQFYPDGLYTQSSAKKGVPTTATKKYLKGFDASNNPQYGNSQVLASTPPLTDKDPAWYGNPTTLRSGEITSSGEYILFDGSKESKGYHIGAIKNNKWLWRTAKVTDANYSGNYPLDGSYDIGNLVNNYAGSVQLALGRNVLWGYHGEFWKASQVNKWTHLYDNGLMVGTFGVTGLDSVANSCFAGMAGNSFSATFVMNPNDSTVAYLYHNDESNNAGVHRWKISGLNTISLDIISFSSIYPADSLDGVDLLAGLKSNSVLANNQDWTRNPQNEKIDAVDKYWSVKTGINFYDQLKSPDLFVKFNSKTATISSVSRYLGENENLSSWRLFGTINYQGNEPNHGNEEGSYFEVLDFNGKIITRFYATMPYYPHAVIYGNTKVIAHADLDSIKRLMNTTLPFQISANSKGITFTYGAFDPVTAQIFDSSSNWQSPRSIRLNFFSNGKGYTRIIDIESMSFSASSNNNISTTPSAPSVISNELQRTITAYHPLGSSEIVVSENDSEYKPYVGKILVGNEARPDGFWKFKIKASGQRNESSVSNSSSFNAAPTAPELIADDSTNTLTASHTLGSTEIIFSENNGPYLQYAGAILVGNVTRPKGYWKFKIKSAALRSESLSIESPVFTTTPSAPVITADDKANTLKALSPLGNSEILWSVNGAPYTEYWGQINVGDVARPAGYWKFKIRSEEGRNESAVIESPAFTTYSTPPVVTGNDAINTLSAYSSLGNDAIVFSENNGPFQNYAGTLDVGDIARPAGYWKFKIKATPDRSESEISTSPAFTKNIDPPAPVILADDKANTLSASSPLGKSEILWSTNGSSFSGYWGKINVGDVARPAGYWKFKIRSADGRNESAIVESPAFTAYSAAPIISANDARNTISAFHILGNNAIVVSENNGPFQSYTGIIDVGDAARPAGYWKFKIKATSDRSESSISTSPAFTMNITPPAPIITSDDKWNTLSASSPLGNSEILWSTNGSSFGGYWGQINVGDVARPAGYWKFKIRSADGRNESAVVESPAYTTSKNNNLRISTTKELNVDTSSSKTINLRADKNSSLVEKKVFTNVGRNVIIYPNPMWGNYLKINLIDFVEGKYRLNLINITGDCLITKILNCTGKNSSHTIYLDKNVAKGIYLVQITGGDTFITKKVIRN